MNGFALAKVLNHRINKYAAFFSFIWKFRKLKGNDLHGNVRQMVGKSGFAIKTGVVYLQVIYTSGHRMGRCKLNVTKYK